MRNIKTFISLLLLLACSSGFSQIVVQSADRKPTLPYGIKNEKQWAKVHEKWESRNYQARIYLHDESKIDGQLLFRNDTATFYLNSTYEFLNPLEISEKTSYVLNGDIEKIIINDYWRNKDGITKGVVIGLGIGLGSGFVLSGVGLGASFSLGPILAGSMLGIGIPSIGFVENRSYKAPDVLAYSSGKNIDIDCNKYYFFPEYLPPTIEIGDHGLQIVEGQKEFLPIKDLFNSASITKRVFRQPKFSIFPHIISNSLEHINANEGIAVSFNFSHRHSLGYQYGSMEQSFGEDQSLISSEEIALITTHGLNYTAKLLSRGDFQFRKLEIFLSGGPTLNKVSTEVEYSLFASSGESVSDRIAYTVEDQLPGWRFLTGMDFYLSRHYSLRVSYGHHQINIQEIPENLMLHPSTNTMKGIEAHDLNFTSRYFYWGVHIHF